MSTEGQILSKPCWGVQHDPTEPRRVAYQLPVSAILAWLSGTPIQVAFPDLSYSDHVRLETGYCHPCLDRLLRAGVEDCDRRRAYASGPGV